MFFRMLCSGKKTVLFYPELLKIKQVDREWYKIFWNFAFRFGSGVIQI